VSDALTNCPKCGFNQPVDQYCANCGVDMLAAQRKSASSLSSIAKQPAAIAGFAVVAIAITFGASKMMRRTPADDIRTTDLASRSSARTGKDNLSQEVSPELRRSLESKMAPEPPQIAAALATNDMAQSATTAAVPSTVAPQVQSHGPGETATPAANAKSAATNNSKSATSAETEIQVAFAWTEVSRPWLQAMGAAEPGLHRVPDLEGRLRDSKGAYRILEVSKQKIEADTSAFAVSRGDHDGDRTGLKVEISAVSENGFAGSIQMSYRGPDGGMRAPAAAALAIEKGQGSILTFPPVPPPPGVAPTGAEIVVLILPRWGGDRNP
jgi:hypothetical protein